MEPLNEVRTSKKKYIDNDVVLVSYTPVINLDDTVTSDTVRKVRKRSKKVPRKKSTVERKVKLKKVGNKQTLIVTQKVPQPTFKCIIHLNANIYDFKQKSHLKSKKKKTKTSKVKKVSEISSSSSEERIIPMCFREDLCCTNARKKIQTNHDMIEVDDKCKKEESASRKHKQSHKSEIIKSDKETKVQKHKDLSRTNKKKLQRKSKHMVKKKKQHGKHLSSLSSEQNNNCINVTDPYYEDISDDSFCLDNEIDLLIKRAKERSKLVRPVTDSKLSPDFSQLEPISSPDFLQTGSTSTPNDFDDNATVFNSEMDVSINSLTTVVLNPLSDIETQYFRPISPNGYTRIKIEEMDEELLIIQDKVLFHTSHDKGSVKHEKLELTEKHSFDNLEHEPYSPSHQIEDEKEINIEQEIIDYDNDLETKQLFSIVKDDNFIDEKEKNLPSTSIDEKIIVGQSQETKHLLGMVKEEIVFSIKNEPYSPSQPIF